MFRRGIFYRKVEAREGALPLRGAPGSSPLTVAEEPGLPRPARGGDLAINLEALQAKCLPCTAR